MNRIVWLDYVKAIAIILVVLFHSGLVTCKLTVPLLALCIPLFFCANGALLLPKRKNMDYFIRKLFKLLFLTLFWSILSSGITSLVRREPVFSFNVIKNAIDLRMGYAHIFWFLLTLFTLYTIYPLIQDAIRDEKKMLYLLVVSFLFSFQLFGYSLPTFHVPNLLANWQSESLFCAVCGYAIAMKPIEKRFNYLQIILTFVCLYLIQLLMFSDIHILNDILIRHTPSDNDAAVFSLYRSPLVMGMMFLLVVLLKKINPGNNDFIRLIGSNTLGIYVLHGAVKKMILCVLDVGNVFVNNLIVFVISFGLSLLFSYLLSKNRYTSFFVSI